MGLAPTASVGAQSGSPLRQIAQLRRAFLRLLAKTITMSVFLMSGLACIQKLYVWQPITEQFPVVTPEGSRSVEAGERYVDVEVLGEGDEGAIAVFYEPESGLFCWVFGLASAGTRPGILDGLRSGSLVYLADDRLVLFTMLHRSLAIRTSSERAESLQDALNAAVAAVEPKKGEFAKGEVRRRGYDLYTLVDLSQVGLDFFFFRNRAEPAPSPEVVAVSLTEGEWEVTVRGPNRDRVVVTLNTSFQLQGIRRLQ